MYSNLKKIGEVDLEENSMHYDLWTGNDVMEKWRKIQSIYYI